MGVETRVFTCIVFLLPEGKRGRGGSLDWGLGQRHGAGGGFRKVVMFCLASNATGHRRSGFWVFVQVTRLRFNRASCWL